jgi:hypothetical protein
LSAIGSVVANWTIPVNPVARLSYGSYAVTVTLIAVPALVVVGALSVSLLAVAWLTLTWAFRVDMPAVETVTVRIPAVSNVNPPVKVCAPASASVNV